MDNHCTQWRGCTAWLWGWFLHWGSYWVYFEESNCLLLVHVTVWPLNVITIFCPRCMYDYIEIRDGSTSDAALMGRLCGNTRPSTQHSSGTTMYIRFRTDGSITHIGFKAKYTIGNPFWIIITFQPSLIDLNGLKCILSLLSYMWRYLHWPEWYHQKPGFSRLKLSRQL